MNIQWVRIPCHVDVETVPFPLRSVSFVRPFDNRHSSRSAGRRFRDRACRNPAHDTSGVRSSRSRPLKPLPCDSTVGVGPCDAHRPQLPSVGSNDALRPTVQSHRRGLGHLGPRAVPSRLSERGLSLATRYSDRGCTPSRCRNCPPVIVGGLRRAENCEGAPYYCK